MKVIKKSLCAALLCVMLLSLCCGQALAAGPIDPDAAASLTVNYHYGSTPISGAGFKIYHIASVDPYTEFTLTDEFAGYPISINDLTEEEWNKLAVTLKGYVNKHTPDYSEKTGSDGKFTVEDMATGLYLVVPESVTIGDYTYTASPSIVCLPGADHENNAWDYNVTINPKAKRSYNPPADETTSRKVLKVWDDKDYEESRPQSVTVTLYANSLVYDVVRLNEGNNWKYSWDKLPVYDDNHRIIEWSIVENEIDANYTVLIEESGKTFVVTNTRTHTEPPPTPPTPPTPPIPPDEPPEGPILPQTGMLWWPVPVLLCSGLVFLIIGVLRRRRYEQ